MQLSNDTLYELTETQVNKIEHLKSEKAELAKKLTDLEDKYEKLKSLLKNTMKNKE